MQDSELSRRLLVIERVACALLILAAAFPRVRGLEASFDRGLSGQRAVAHALAARNASSVDAGGFPVASLRLPEEVYSGFGEPPWAASLSLEGSPLPFVVSRVALSVLAREPDWSGPSEFALRAGFLILHLVALFAFTRAVRHALGAQVSLLALAFLAVSPPALAFGALPGGENVALAPLLFAGAAAMRLQRGGGRAHALVVLSVFLGLVLATLAAPAAGAFGAALALHALVARRGASGFWIGVPALAGPAGALAWLAAHARSVQERLHVDAPTFLQQWQTRWSEASVDSVADLFAGAREAFGLVVLVPATFGLLSVVARLREATREKLDALEYPAPPSDRAQLAPALLIGGLCAAWLEPDAGLARFLWLAPALALLCAQLVQQFTRPILRLRAGIAPLVVAVSAIGLPCLARHAALTRRASGPTPREFGRAITELELPADVLWIVPEDSGLERVTAFYADRVLVPQAELDVAAAGTVAVELNLVPFRVGMLLPTDGELAPDFEQAARTYRVVSEGETLRAWLLGAR